MEIKLEKRTFEGTGVQERASFKIKPDALMFRKLSKDIYQNPLQAVFRELLSNAVDACNLDPSKVSVTLPSIQNSSLIISDQGRGMSHEFVMDRYTTYGESTKSSDNNAIGGFGFGGKTPFSLTNSFSLQVFSPTELRTYSCFINEQSFPDIALVFQGPNVHKNRKQGVDVTVPIKSSDFVSLEKYAKALQFTMYLEYGTTFNINGQKYDEALFIEAQFLRNKDAVIVKNTAPIDVFQGVHQLIMGGIPYPLSNLSLPAMSRNSALYGSIIIFFGKIGEFGVTLSREQIEINADVKYTIELKYKSYMNYCIGEAQAWLETNFSTLSEKDKLRKFNNIENNAYCNFLSAESKGLAKRYSSVMSYYNSFEPGAQDRYRSIYSTYYITFSKDFLVVDGSILRKKQEKEPLEKNVSPDKVVNVVNDTKFTQEALILRLHRLTKSKLVIPKSLQTKKYFVFVSDQIKSVAAMETAYPAIDAFSASKIIEELIPDEKSRKKFIENIKPIERIRFKKCDFNGIVRAITIEEVENIVGPVYYSSLDGKNCISVTKRSHKDHTTNANLLLNFGLTELYLVPANKEKLLDSSVFIKLDTIIDNKNFTVFEKHIKDVALTASVYEYDNTRALSIIKENYSKLKDIMINTKCTNKDIIDFLGKAANFINTFKPVLPKAPNSVLYAESDLFKKEIQKWESRVSETTDLMQSLLEKYTLLVKDNVLFLREFNFADRPNLLQQIRFYLTNIDSM